jgi:hypothetical protein
MFDEIDERLPEFLQRLCPSFFAARHGVELIFHRGGEAVVDISTKVRAQKVIDDLTDIGRDEASSIHIHVFAIFERGDDRRVSRRPADSMLFQGFDQRGF